MLVCDMSGTIIKENDIVYNNLFKTIKTIEPNVTKYDIKKFYGCGKHEILKFFINKKYNNDEEKKIIFKEYNMKYNDLIKNDYKNNNNIELIHPKLINYFNHLRQNDIKISLNTEYSKEIQEILSILGRHDYLATHRELDLLFDRHDLDKYDDLDPKLVAQDGGLGVGSRSKVNLFTLITLINPQ